MQGYDFEDALEATVSAEMARLEIKKHGLEWSDFVAEVGDKPTYTGREVLIWLGY